MLDELIRTELAKKNLSYREAAARSGGRITYSTLNRIARGEYCNRHSEETLRGIALAIGVPLSRVRQEAGRPVKESQPFVLPDAARFLTQKQRRAVLAVISGMLSSED